MGEDPQAPDERRVAARHLVQHPLCCMEHDPEVFRLIRRHEVELDRWFTQRLGYRLHLDADTARLFKIGVIAHHRPLHTATGRAFQQFEYVLLALVLACTAAGPAVISLRDLVDNIRSAAVEADITLAGDASERRAVVAVLRWMIDHGLAAELHAQVDAYAADDEADAVIKVRPDRVALLSLPTLAGATDRADLLERAERRTATRQWMRARLVEDPVLYRADLTESEWGELRRRLGEEERLLDEMFGLVLEARAEGVAAIDPSGALAEQRFPSGGTLGHAALLLIDAVRPAADSDVQPLVSVEAVRDHLRALISRHVTRWANNYVEAPDLLARHVIELLVSLDLAQPEGDDAIRLLPAAARFLAVEREPEADAAMPQDALW